MDSEDMDQSENKRPNGQVHSMMQRETAGNNPYALESTYANKLQPIKAT